MDYNPYDEISSFLPKLLLVMVLLSGGNSQWTLEPLGVIPNSFQGRVSYLAIKHYREYDTGGDGGGSSVYI